MIEIALEPLGDRERLRTDWQDLERRADARFFLSWHWIGAWLATTEATVHRLTAHEGERILGLALLVHGIQVRHRMLRVPTLFLNQTGVEAEDVVTIEFNDLLAERGREAEVRRAVLHHLAATDRLDGRRFDALVWRGAVGGLERDLDAAGLAWRHLTRTSSAFVDLARIRASGRAYLSHLRPNTRHQVRRARSLYEARGPLRLEVAASKAQALDFFRAAGVLHQRRWRPRGKPGAFAYPFYVGFHERLIAAGVPAGVVELVRVSAGEQPIGYLYNFRYNRHVDYYFSGFRFEDDKRLKPGMVTHSLCIEHHLTADDADVYDFMGGDERYKLNLGEPGPEIVGVVIERPRPLLRAEATLRRMKRQLVDSTK